VAVRLPYEFDTSRVFRQILMIMVGLVVVLLVGVVYSLFGGRWGAVAALSVSAGLLTWFGVRILRNASGGRGTITREGVVVTPGELLGVSFSGPSGRFAIERFRAVRVEEVSGPVDPDVQGGPHERIYLVGKTGTPDVLIARTDRSDELRGVALGREMADLLGLESEVVSVAR
jgi:hypothetical protein